LRAAPREIAIAACGFERASENDAWGPHHMHTHCEMRPKVNRPGVAEAEGHRRAPMNLDRSRCEDRAISHGRFRSEAPQSLPGPALDQPQQSRPPPPLPIHVTAQPLAMACVPTTSGCCTDVDPARTEGCGGLRGEQCPDQAWGAVPRPAEPLNPCTTEPLTVYVGAAPMAIARGKHGDLTGRYPSRRPSSVPP